MSRTAVQKVSDKQEKRTASKYGGWRTPMSGAGWKHKGDVKTDRFLIENKTKLSPTAKSFSIKLEQLRKITKEALASGRTGILQFDLGGHSYVILREDDFLEILDELV